MTMCIAFIIYFISKKKKKNCFKVWDFAPNFWLGILLVAGQYMGHTILFCMNCNMIGSIFLKYTGMIHKSFHYFVRFRQCKHI